MQLTLAKNSEMAIEKKPVTPGIKAHSKCNMLVKQSLKVAQPVDSYERSGRLDVENN